MMVFYRLKEICGKTWTKTEKQEQENSKQYLRMKEIELKYGERNP